MPKKQLRSPSVPQVSHANRPGDGFYNHVNHSWLKEHHIRSWNSEYSASTEIQDITDDRLLTLITKAQRTMPHSEIYQLASQWKNHTVSNEEMYIKLCLNELVSTDRTDIARVFGWVCRSGIATVCKFIIQEEPVAPYFARASLTPGSLTLPIQYYLNSSLQKSDVWTAYTKYISICSIELGLPFLHHAIDGEQHLAKILNASDNSFTKNMKGYKLQSWVPEFPWSDFFSTLAIDAPLGKWKSRIWLIDTPDTVKRIVHWVSTAKLEQVIAVLSLHILLFGSPYLRPSIHTATNDLFYKALRGVTHDAPEKYHFLRIVQSVLPEELCRIYAKDQYSSAKVEDCTSLVEALRTAAIEIMGEATILSNKTISAAKEKIHRMRFHIGSCPEESKPKKVELETRDSFLHTVVSIQHDTMNTIHTLLGKPFNTILAYPCFIVNASYYSESNQIIIPWAILQWPFYSNDAPLGWNYGGIGATIAHEMTHGFDLDGSQYSPRATFKEWWTRKDRKHFKQRTRKVRKFYSEFTQYGIHLNGKKTLSEDWADFGGITIALRGLKILLDSMVLNPLEIKEAYRQFFIAYAVSWRTLVRKKQMVYSILSSVHSPAKDRVDRIVPQFQEWVDAFDIKETDPLYLPLGKRLKFF